MANLEAALAQAIAEAEQFAKAGDIIAEMLGYTVAAVEAGEGFTDEQMAGAREAILIWRRMRAG